jgi:hypothetical protein
MVGAVSREVRVNEGAGEGEALLAMGGDRIIRRLKTV